MILLDTHIWLWWISQNTDRLPSAWQTLIANADRICVSPVSCFEVALAHKKGRIQLPCSASVWIESALHPAGIELAPITAPIAVHATQLSHNHQDPFDCIIIATAIAHQATLLSVDGQFKHFSEIQHLIPSICA